MPTVIELGAELDRDRQELHKLFEMHKVDGMTDQHTGGPVFDFDESLLTEVRNRKDALVEKEKAYQAARLAEEYNDNLQGIRDLHTPDRKYAIPGASGGSASPGAIGRGEFLRSLQAEGKKLSDFFMESREYKARASNRRRYSVELPEFDLKTLFVSPHLAQEAVRQPVVVPYAMRRLVVSDLIPQTTTDANVIRYMEQTVFGDNAATVSESGVKPEAQTEWVERSDEVEKIAVWIPVTEEALDDTPQLRALLDETLREMVLREEEDQLLTGNGTRPNLVGFLNKAGVQTQAMGADNAADAFYRAFTKVRWTGYAEPSGIIIHPNDWEPIRLLKTSQLEYIWGHPSVVGPDTLWGKPVVVTNAITEGTGLTGDFQMFSRIYRKTGLRIDISDSHSDYFIYNKLAIRAEERLALIITRPSAFVKVTGI